MGDWFFWIGEASDLIAVWLWLGGDPAALTWLRG